MLKSSSNNLMFHHNTNSSYGNSPRDLLTNQVVSATAGNNASPMMNNSFTPLNVQRITHSAGSSEDAVVMVKLTDEMFAALEECQKSGKKIRINVNEHGGTIELGDGTASSMNNNTFRFQKQNLSDSTDTLVQTGGNVRNVGTYKTKYQIQATDKSFEETRKRAEKRAEVEKSRGTKEMKKTIPTSSSSRFAGTSTSSTPRSLGASSHHHQSSRVSPAFAGTKASTSQLPSKGTPNGGVGASSRTEMLKPELMRKSLKKRVIHLIVTQKYKNSDEVYKRLESDGLPEDKDILSKVREIVRDVSEMTPTSVNLSLRPSFLSEVDARWIFFNQEEKAMVRKLQTTTGARTANVDSSFAPMRKKGMERMTASSRMTDKEKEKLQQNDVKTTSTPEKIPTPPSADVNSASKRVERMEVDDDVYNMPPQGVKRKAHAPSSSSSHTVGRNTPIENVALSQMEKRARRHDSSSPPEDPMTNISTAAQQIHSKISSTTSAVIHAPLPRPDSHSHSHSSHNVGGANGGGSTASSRVSSPASSLSSPSQPSCDWEKQFGEIKKMSDAETYFELFHKEYPIYMECYKKLTEVSKEFRRLDGKLQSANSRKNNSSSQAAMTMAAKDVISIERDIQNRYMSYEKDPEFLRARQKHTDLRSKLGVLKTRITNWEQRQNSV